MIVIAAAARAATAQSRPLVSTGVYAQHLADSSQHLDPGRGIVAFRTEGEMPQLDSLPLYSAPSDRTPMGWFVVNRAATEGEPFFIRAPTRVRPNTMEFAYEESALPIDSLSADHRWARVLYGFDNADRPLTAWTPAAAPNATLHLWNNYFGDKALHFLPAFPPAFYDAPNGKPLSITLVGEQVLDYIMYVAEQQGEWMRVRVMSPSDYCAEGSAPPKTAWVRYLTPQGRPRVWYATRGC